MLQHGGLIRDFRETRQASIGHASKYSINDQKVENWLPPSLFLHGTLKILPRYAGENVLIFGGIILARVLA